MSDVTAVISLLHQPAAGHAGRRLFRGEPVLSWTLRRLRRCNRVTGIAVVCWDDQAEVLREIAGAEAAGGTAEGVAVRSKGTRTHLAHVEGIAAARRWADGWRGGLLGACAFDLGFDAKSAEAALSALGGDAVLLVDPDAALIDPIRVEQVIAHADARPSIEYCFTPAAPGVSAVLVRPGLLRKLAQGNGHLGWFLNYFPDRPGKDPIAKEECAPVPTPLARTTHRFTIDSRRQAARFSEATAELNGELLRADAEALLACMNRADAPDALPRDVVLEINTARATRPIHWPGRHLTVSRPDLSLDEARALFAELAASDDVRLTLGGVGDPLLHANFFEILDAARDAGIRAVHVETDLLPADASAVGRLAESDADVVSVHLPATSVQTYAAVMGADALAAALGNLGAFVKRREARGRGTPLLVPTFTKCRENLHEMEAWYDHWLAALGAAVVVGPSDCAGQLPDVAAADMAPPRRRACRRLASRMTVLSNGAAVSCEQDVLGLQSLGRIGRQPIDEIWRNNFDHLRSAQAAGDWKAYPLCAKCREWHRP